MAEQVGADDAVIGGEQRGHLVVPAHRARRGSGPGRSAHRLDRPPRAPAACRSAVSTSSAPSTVALGVLGLVGDRDRVQRQQDRSRPPRQGNLDPAPTRPRRLAAPSSPGPMPSSSARSASAAMIRAMCSSRSTPSSSIPRWTWCGPRLPRTTAASASSSPTSASSPRSRSGAPAQAAMKPELVHGVERLRHLASRAGPPGTRRAGDRVDHLLRIAEPFELLQRVAQVPRVEVRVALVVEVVDQPGDRVQLLVLALAGVGAPSPPPPQQVLAQRVGLDPLASPAPMHRLLRPLPSLAITLDGDGEVRHPGGTLSRARSSPAGNKNAALPILAACLLTDEELVICNVPRIRDVDSMLAAARGPGRQGRVERRQRGPAAGDAVDEHTRWTRSPPSASAPRSSPPGRCWRASARPGSRLPGATRSAAAASTPTSTPSRTWAPWSEASPRSSSRRPPTASSRCIFMDEPSVMGTENALMAAALTEGRPRSATPAREPHVQDLARLLSPDGGRGRRHRLQRDDRQRPRQARRRRAQALPRPHRDRQLHGPRRHHRRRAAHPRRRPRRPGGIRRQFRRLGLQSMVEGHDVLVHPSRSCASATTRATRSRRSTTAPGRPSRPTSPRSRSRWRPRRTGRS